MTRLLVTAFLLALPALSLAQATRPALAATPADMETIRTRFVASLLPAPGRGADDLVAQARQLVGAMTPEHTWADVVTTDQARSMWRLRDQLDRALVIAKSHAITRRAGSPDAALARAANDALAYWIRNDFKNPNWWWNEIGVPQLVGETSLCLGDDLRPEIRDGVIDIMKRSVWAKWTGQNLVWGVTNQVLRGLLSNQPDLVAAAYARMYEEVVVTTKEGIQPDYSFWQHGNQFYSGGYGLAYANDVGRFVSFAWGTGCQAPPEKIDIFNHFMLDGQAWMTWGRIFDYSAVGREITRPGKAAVVASWAGGPVSPVGRAYGLAHTTYLLSQLPLPRQGEYQTFATRLLSDPLELAAGKPQATLNGNRHYWRSDYTAHRRPGYLFTVKMFSTRLRNAELVNLEGKKSHHLGDGNTFLYRTAREYADIFPAWDWQKLPGTTAEQADDLDKLLPKGYAEVGKTSFVGGASDGTYGVTAMHLRRGGLSAFKSWFCLDDEIVCLGSDITCPSDNRVVTTLEQCNLAGPVEQGPGSASDERQWFHHNQVGYVHAAKTPAPASPAATVSPLTASAGPRTGSWAEIGAGSGEKITRDVFTLTLDHGPRPDGASYAYILLPGATKEQTAARARDLGLEILSQSSTAHAVRHPALGLTAVAFFKAGRVGDIEVDHPCIVMIRGGRLTACNPENKPLKLTVAVGGESHTLALPDGPLAGSSVTVPLHGSGKNGRP